MRPGPLLFSAVFLGALVWSFAIIGVLSVTAAPNDDARPSVSPLLQVSEVEGRDVIDIPRYPDAERTEYRRTAFGEVTYIEIEYLADAPIDDVRAYYRSQLSQHGWQVVDARLDRGESAYVIVKEPRIGRIEIESVDGMVEIEIELDIPTASRGTTTDR